MSTRRTVLSVMALAALAQGAALAADKPAKPAMEKCYGVSLAGQNDWYLVTQLKNFKAGFRGSDPLDTFGAPMRAMAAGLRDEQAIIDVVSYINTLGR